MKKLKNFLQWFVYITTGILIVTAVSFTVLDDDTMPTVTLWQVLLAGFLTSGVTTLFAPDECATKRSFFIRIFAHYLCICAVMVICGTWYGWMHLNLSGIVMMCVDVALVYGITMGLYCFLEIKNADELNRKLQEKYNSDETE